VSASQCTDLGEAEESRFNATQKTALAQAIFHRLVFEYFTCVYRFSDAETADKKMHELLTA
jgi:pumilio family protein 6